MSGQTPAPPADLRWEHLFLGPQVLLHRVGFVTNITLKRMLNVTEEGKRKIKTSSAIIMTVTDIIKEDGQPLKTAAQSKIHLVLKY